MFRTRTARFDALADHTVGWVDLATEAYTSLPARRRLLIDERLDRLAADPEAGSTYDPATAWWTATYAEGTGLIMFANSARHRRLIVLRILDLT